MQPDDVTILLLRGRVHSQQGQTDAALNDFNPALQLKPDNPAGLLERSRFLSQQGSYDQALADATAALALQRDDRAGLLARARVYALTNQPQPPGADLDKLLSLDANNVEARVLRARLYSSQQLNQQALSELNTAAAMQPGDPASFKARAALLRQLGDSAGAEADLVLRGNQVHHNIMYSLDPHTRSMRLVIESNVAHDNGKQRQHLLRSLCEERGRPARRRK